MERGKIGVACVPRDVRSRLTEIDIGIEGGGVEDQSGTADGGWRQFTKISASQNRHFSFLKKQKSQWKSVQNDTYKMDYFKSSNRCMQTNE